MPNIIPRYPQIYLSHSVKPVGKLALYAHLPVFTSISNICDGLEPFLLGFSNSDALIYQYFFKPRQKYRRARTPFFGFSKNATSHVLFHDAYSTAGERSKETHEDRVIRGPRTLRHPDFHLPFTIPRSLSACSEISPVRSVSER